MPYFYKFTQLLFAIIIISTHTVMAQAPAGYYTDAENKTGYALKTELFFIIDNHTNRGYTALWDFYSTADVRTDGFVWDIYSNCDLVFGTDQDAGSGGTTECDKYNREHTFPQSWFDSDATPRADAHMVLPTDKKVNSERGNFPYGEVSSASYISSNGSKKGNNTFTGYSGVVFEPIDEYKGDLARIYFYMATRYQSQIDAWETSTTESNVVLNGTVDQVFEGWVLEMLIKWHNADPVSQKEIDRNNDVNNYQGNRNPFVDHPEWVSCIWENNCIDATTPSLTTSTTSLQFGTVEYASTPEIQNFSISGANLTEMATISANDVNFTVSTSSNSGFTNSLQLTPNAEGLMDQIIYVQFAPTQDLNAAVNGLITISQSEVTNLEIAVNGTVQEQPQPAAEIITTIAPFEANLFYVSSVESQSINLTGSNLESDVTITLNNDFKISLNDVDYMNTINIAPDNSGNINTTLYVNFLPATLTEGEYTGQLILSSVGQTFQTIDLSANIYTQDDSFVLTTSISNLNFGRVFYGETTEIKSFDLTGINLTGSATLTSNREEFLISTTANSGFGNSLMIAPSATGDINETIYVQFLALNNITETINSAISITQSETQDLEVKLSVEVKEMPTPGLALDNSPEVFSTNIFYSSNIQAQEIGFQAVGIYNLLEIKSNNGFKVSSDNNQFAESIQFDSNVDKEVINQFWIDFQPETLNEGSYSGELTFVSENETIYTLALNAEIKDLDTIIVLNFVNDTILANTDQPLYEITVQSQRKLETPLSLQVRMSNFNNIFYPAQFAVTPAADGTLINLHIPENDSIAVIQLVLDTALLKTDTEKSFSVSLLGSDFYQIGDKPKVTVNIAPYIREVTANTSAKGHIIQLYPNPAGDMLHIDNIQSATFTIFDIHGKKVKSGNIDDPKIDVKQLAKGLYYLQIKIEGDEYNNAVKFMKK